MSSIGPVCISIRTAALPAEDAGADEMPLAGPPADSPAAGNASPDGPQAEAGRALSGLHVLQRQPESAGDNPPPGLLAKIQIATQAYGTTATLVKAAADSKGQIRGELARFR